ncbi:methyltransferase domain-containing protein [Pseudooceanicola sp. MF1-13]|uniref:class I SAM-dependent DNA methyltransferase n=1 Tax=Pseudooceanicola sp. MF1-13 TaxID=3379095 RepID=UPI0038922E47
MTPLLLSSGDLIADRRAAYAEAMLPDDISSAAQVMQQALELAPDWVAGWYRLGEMLRETDRHAAAAAFDRALTLDPQDQLGAALMLDTLRDRSLADTMPAAFVETLFDQYAAGFDAALVGRLDYRAPQLLRAGLSKRYDRALDLGCGTGLMGAELRGITNWLEGWDISGEMLREAEDKSLYEHLAKRNLAALPPTDPTWDLITAADVFAYLGALEQIVSWVAGALKPGGHFAFTVEWHDGPEAYVLRDSRRYAHSRGAIAALLQTAGFEATIQTAQLRLDRGAPILGLIVHARLTAGMTPDHQGDGEDAAFA